MNASTKFGLMLVAMMEEPVNNKTEFERQLLALDRNKLANVLLGVLTMYDEYIYSHGYTIDVAKWAAINEVIGGTEAMVELDDAGEL